MSINDTFEVGDRVVIDPEQWEALLKEDRLKWWPTLQPRIPMTITAKRSSEEVNIEVYQAESDPCPHCGMVKQTMNGFGAVWFKKVEEE